MNSIELGYLSGYFDGDGCVVVHYDERGGDGGYPRWRLQLDVVSSSAAPLLMFRDHFEGVIQRLAPLPTGRARMTWRVTGVRAVAALRAMYPQLKVKRLQALVGSKMPVGETGQEARREKQRIRWLLQRLKRRYGGQSRKGPSMPKQPSGYGKYSG